MQGTVVRVKRHLDEKQFPGIRVAKRQKTQGEELLQLKFVGTANNADLDTVKSVIGALNREEESGENSESRVSHDDSIKPSGKNVNIYDASCKKHDEIEFVAPGADQKVQTNENFVYDIYYTEASTSDRFPESEDFHNNYILEYLNEGECEILVNCENQEDSDGFEDDDSNAEDNPNNDYPDEDDDYNYYKDRDVDDDSDDESRDLRKRLDSFCLTDY